MQVSGLMIVFNSAADEDGLWPYYVPVGGHTETRLSAGVVRRKYHEHVWILSLAGEGRVMTGGGEFAMPPGTFAWLDTSKPYAHGAAAEEVWRYVWMSVRGHGIDALHAHCGLWQHPTVSDCGALAGNFDRVLDGLRNGMRNAQSDISAAVSRILGAVAQARFAEEAPEETDLVSRVMAVMRGDLKHQWGIAELSDTANISESQLFRRFKQGTGQSPMAWLRQERMVAAQYLLRATDQAVGEIAQQCGYADPFHFSRDFKRLVGVSPRDFRLDNRQT